MPPTVVVVSSTVMIAPDYNIAGQGIRTDERAGSVLRRMTSSASTATWPNSPVGAMAEAVHHRFPVGRSHQSDMAAYRIGNVIPMRLERKLNR